MGVNDGAFCEESLNFVKLQEMIDVLAEEAEIHSIVIQYKDKIIAEGAWEPFTLEDPQMMHSLSKIGTSFCVGFAVDEGKLSLKDKILDYLREELPVNYDPSLEELTIEDLLTMRAGSPVCCNNVWFSKLKMDWETHWLGEPKIKEDIGNAFHYDSGCSYTLSEIVSKVMGKTCLELLEERVFSKMNFGKVHWLTSPEGVNTGGWGMYLTARQIVKLGQLILQGGKWKEEQLVPKKWIEEMKKPRVMIPESVGKALDSYAYHIKSGKDIFAAEGAFGQYMICFRNIPLVIALTSGTSSENLADICLKYVKEAVTLGQSKDPAKEQELLDKMKNLAKSLPIGEQRGSTQWEALIGKKIVFTENPRNIEEIVFTLEAGLLCMNLLVEGKRKECIAGYRTWYRNDMYPGDFTKEYQCLSYAFRVNELQIINCLINTSYREEYILACSRYGISCTWKPNVTYLKGDETMTWKFTGKVLE